MTTVGTRPGAPSRVPAFVEGLRGRGDRPAVVTAGEEVSYRDLAERVDRAAAALGTRRRLVQVEAANDLPTLVGYLGALRGGHVALLAARTDRRQVAALVDRFDPDAVVGADGSIRARRAGSAHRLHPDLALLMATSGSTGTPRLVRLTTAALDANAAAIATYLGIQADDRAALTLPVHYCYGLSVVNSNLRCGAAVLLYDASVLDQGFWSAVRDHRATSLHGVPHTFALLDHAGFADMDLPDLRYVTQAGGRLAPDQVRRWARTGRDRGWAFYVMYGQTEATARMAYLPPELAETHPEAVGVAIPGGAFTVEALDPTDGPTLGADVGELVYRGPNVMLGYADDPSDLALGRTVDVLRTGDLGRRRPDGLIEVVGRRSRFVKPFGIRTDLDGLEHLLADHDIEAACTGTDARLVVAARTTPALDAEHLRRRIRGIATDRLGLPAAVVEVVAVDELPRRPNGKPDYRAVAALADAGLSRPAPAPRGAARPATIREVFARTFPGQVLTDDASFVDLGGDSLTYVQVAADVGRVLGQLPDGWDHLPLAALEGMAAPGGPPARVTGRATVETAVLLRAVAIVLVVGVHTHLWGVLGGAHLLLVLAGWTFARFTLVRPARDPAGEAHAGQRGAPRRILVSAARLAVPSMAWIAFRALTHGVRWIDVLLVGSLVPPLVPGYWFVDTLVQILLVLALVFTLPVLRRLERRHPFGFAAALLVLALPGRLFPTATGWWFSTDIYSPQVVLWLFALGWLVHRARTRAQKLATLGVVLVLVPTFFGADLGRTLVVGAGLVLLQFLPTARVPRPVATASTAVASASLGIYLTHFAVLPLATLGVPAAVVAAVGVAVGIAATTAVTATVRCVARRRHARAEPGGWRPPHRALVASGSVA